MWKQKTLAYKREQWALETGKGQEGKGKTGITYHSSEAGGTHSAVLCYNIIAYFGAGRELSGVAQACNLLGRLMQEDAKLKAILGNSVRWLNW